MSEEDTSVENNQKQKSPNKWYIEETAGKSYSQGTSDQDKADQDFDEIKLEIVNTEKANENQSDRNSVVNKSLNDQYKQFYGGSEDDHSVTPYSVKKQINTQGYGTILGVYFPCLQNILNVVIFLRMSAMVGEAGIFQALVIMFLGKATTCLTILSMSAIATNGKIRTGGVYYLVSRSLGPASGGTIGLLYYIATTFSSGMSIIGAVETLQIAAHFHLGPEAFSIRFFSLVILALLIILNLFGRKYVHKTGQILIIFVFISILSVLLGLFSSKRRNSSIQQIVPGLDGLHGHNFVDNWKSHYDHNSFHLFFAIFFNACTGILTGANVSGDLRNPSQSIPRGTIAAHMTTTVLYFLLIILFGAAGTREALKTLDVVVSAIVAWPSEWVVYIGIILASIAAALNNISNSPLVIKAIVDDDMLPKFFNFMKNDFKKSLFFTAVLIVGAISFGSLDHVAPLVTIFYLLCYGGVNISCFLQDWLGSPNWRPRWKYYHKATAFAGVILCVTCMVIISWWASLASIVGAMLIYVYLEGKSQEKNWGDGIEGMRAERARNALLKIDKTKKHVKNWRPHYLALGYINEKGKISAPGVFKLLHQLRKGTGLAIYGCVIKGDYTQEAYEEARNKEKELEDFMKKNKYNLFSKVVVSQNIENGMVYLLQSSGLGGLEPNTILLSWPSQWESDELKSTRFVNLINHAKTVGHLLTILKPQKEFDNELKHIGTIDIWSFNFEKGMLLLIAQILLKNSHWRRCVARLFVVTSLPEAESETMKRVTREYLDRYRLLSENVYIEVVHVDPQITTQFTQNLNDTLKKKEKVFQQAIQTGNKDFEYGTLPSLMKLKALQEKEIKASLQTRLKRDIDQDIDELIENGKKLNSMIMERSKDASLVITNLPPVINGQNAQEYLSFCQAMTENIKRVIFIQNSSKEVLTQYS